MTLQERLDAFKASFESGTPPFNVPQSAIEIMHRATEELRRSGQAERALAVGARTPAGLGTDPAHGKRHKRPSSSLSPPQRQRELSRPGPFPPQVQPLSGNA